jgi:hypothetical protein
MIINKEKCIDILQNEDYCFKSSFCSIKERNIIKNKRIGWTFRYNNFCFELSMASTNNYEHLLFHIGCMTTAPYSKIAIVTVSKNSSMNEFDLFKETGRYGMELREYFRFAYSIDRDEESIKSVKEFTKGFNTENLYYLDEVSEWISKDVISKTFRVKRPSISIPEIIYQDKFYTVNNDLMEMKQSFIKTLLGSSEYEVKTISPVSKIKEKNDFMFVAKDFSIKHEGFEHNFTIRVGRSRIKESEKYAVINIDKSCFYIKLDKNNSDLNYNKCVELSECLISDILKEEIHLISNIVTSDHTSRKKMYSLSRTTDAGNYEDGSSSYSNIMAISDDKDDLVKRYNESVKEENSERLLIKLGQYNTSYSGNTGGGHSSVFHRVEVKEFRDFDMPEIER